MNRTGWVYGVSVLMGVTAPSLCLAFLGFGKVVFSEPGEFSESAISRGVSAEKEQCDRVANAVWAVTQKSGAECLKYWVAGFDALPVKRAVVFFHGDIWSGAGKTRKSYLDLTNEKLQQDAEKWATRLNYPYIFFARPGTHGSSGDHMQRRRIAESELISVALDEIKKRYGIEELVIAGQSGGGHVTASLLTLRTDIVCAVPTSSVSSPRIRWEMMRRSIDTTGYSDSYEPAAYVRKEKVNARLRVFVLGDPNDKNVFWPSQTVLAEALEKESIPVAVLRGEGTGSDNHSLSESARTVAGWCAQEIETDDIINRAAKGLKG